MVNKEESVVKKVEKGGVVLGWGTLIIFLMGDLVLGTQEPPLLLDMGIMEEDIMDLTDPSCMDLLMDLLMGLHMALMDTISLLTSTLRMLLRLLKTTMLS
mmetsp:Transcript_10824/g.14053  ORF Transcript_10824/g.14053 Transcript_10824/m.14053 type:complete len:100 (+) Transcript_10824:958-1257(+)